MYRFTIRDLVLVTVIVALAVGWWIDRIRLISTHEQRMAQWQAERLALIDAVQNSFAREEALREQENSQPDDSYLKSRLDEALRALPERDEP